jgi:hypothetical protein
MLIDVTPAGTTNVSTPVVVYVLLPLGTIVLRAKNA